MRVDIDQHDFRTDVLDLAQDWVGWTGGKSHMAEHIAAHLRAIQTVLEHGKALVFFRQQSNRYTVHGTRFISVSPPMLLRDKGSSQVTVVTKLIANSPLPENRKLQLTSCQPKWEKSGHISGQPRREGTPAVN